MKTMQKAFLRIHLILFILITTCVSASSATADSMTYTYDNTGRLIMADYGDGQSITYAYDKMGNILERVVTAEPANVDPVSDVKVNGSDGPVVLSQGDNLNVTIALDPGNHLGKNADWWIAIFYYDQATGSLIPIFTTGFQVPLLSLPATSILNTTGLPASVFLFLFGVDMVPSGLLDPGQFFSDFAIALVQ